MNLKTISIVMIALSLGACASVPPPPHCEDNGQGLQPINPEMINQVQVSEVRLSEKDAAKGLTGDIQGVDK